MANILVVDDERSICEYIARSLRSLHHLVSTAQDGETALLRLHNETPDLVVLDIMLPDMSGLDICHHIRATPELASICVLMLTARERIDDRIRGFQVGADDYLPKPFDIEELLFRVKALLRRTDTSGAAASHLLGGISLNANLGRVSIAGRSIDLTPSEFNLFAYIISHAGEVISSERLLQDVWGYPPGVGKTSLVRTHVLNIRRKIEPNKHKPQYLCSVPRRGYILQLPREETDQPLDGDTTQ